MASSPAHYSAVESRTTAAVVDTAAEALVISLANLPARCWEVESKTMAARLVNSSTVAALDMAHLVVA